MGRLDLNQSIIGQRRAWLDHRVKRLGAQRPQDAQSAICAKKVKEETGNKVQAVKLVTLALVTLMAAIAANFARDIAYQVHAAIVMLVAGGLEVNGARILE